MRVAVIYRPRSAAPPEGFAGLMGLLGEWVQTWSGRVDTMEFFVVGGGLVLGEFADTAHLHRMVAENPFTPYMDVEIMPVREPGEAMATFGEISAALAGAQSAN